MKQKNHVAKIPCRKLARPFSSTHARERHAIAAARAWARGKIKCGAARAAAVAAHSAARAAKHPSAIAAARAAGHAAATAHMAGHAKITTAYAMKSARAAKMEAEKTNLSPLGKRI